MFDYLFLKQVTAGKNFLKRCTGIKTTQGQDGLPLRQNYPSPDRFRDK